MTDIDIASPVVTLDANDATRHVLELPKLQLWALTHEPSQEAADIAGRCALRGADAVYVATARACGAVLVTLHAEVITRGAAVLEVAQPQTLLSALSTPL